MFAKRLAPALAALVLANSTASAEDLPERSKTIVVFGEDRCPEPEEGEIVVCARQPETERYRIPKELRDDRNGRPSESSWGSRVAAMEEDNRISMPGSCSVVGSGGQSGCRQQSLRQWYDWRRSRR